MFPPSRNKTLESNTKFKRKLTDDESIVNKRQKGNENDEKIESNKVDTKNETIFKSWPNQESPKFGQIVDRRNFRRAGPYILGQKIGHSPVDSVVQYLAKKENSNQFFQLKILMLSNNTRNEKLMQDERHGKMLLHTEFSLLSLLHNQPGVIQQHGMFSDLAYEEDQSDLTHRESYYTGKVRKRLVLVLDCVTPHDFEEKSLAFVNLQQYLINRKRMTEIETLKIYYEIVLVVENLHKNNIIHRDLKLGNIVLNTHSRKVKLINFCLGKYLINENHLLNDQRGSPAYISPDVLCGTPYRGKPSDMWALGVVLYMMLYRQFPFFESTPTALFKKIKSAEYNIPAHSEISHNSNVLIQGLLQLNPRHRLTATELREQLEALFGRDLPIPWERTVPGSTSAYTTNTVDPVQVINSVRSRVYKRHCSDQIVPNVSQAVLDSIEYNRGNPRTNVRVPIPTIRNIDRSIHNSQNMRLENLLEFIRTTDSDSQNNSPNSVRLSNGCSPGNTANSTQVTQQMSNLTLRSHRESPLSNRRSAIPSTASPARSIISVPSPFTLRDFARVPQIRQQRASVSANVGRLTQANGTENDTSDAVSSGDSIEQLEIVIPRIPPQDIQSFFETINNQFLQGLITPPNPQLQEFNGFLTRDLATMIGDWLIREHYDNTVVQSVFMQRGSSLEKVLHLLRQCGIEMQTGIRGTKIKRQQSINLLLLLTYLLHAVGYSNTYFIPD